MKKLITAMFAVVLLSSCNMSEDSAKPEPTPNYYTGWSMLTEINGTEEIVTGKPFKFKGGEMKIAYNTYSENPDAFGRIYILEKGTKIPPDNDENQDLMALASRAGDTVHIKPEGDYYVHFVSTDLDQYTIKVFEKEEKESTDE